MKLALLATSALLLVGAPAGAQRATPRGGRVDPAVLAKIEARGKASQSDAIVIYQDGTLVAEWYFGQPQGPIEAMSATKSIVNLAIGKLIDQRKLRLDQPVSELYPEWKQGKKRSITIRHLLNHTSGIQNVRMSGEEIYPAPDLVKLALAAELSEEPGTTFRYNNKAVNLLAGIVQLASGKRMDVFLGEEVFTPLGITDWSWTLDTAGNPHAMAGLQIRARDLATIGRMMLAGGTWNGKQVISRAWITESTKPGQALDSSCGLLWWLQSQFRSVVANDALIAQWRTAGNPESFIAKVLPLKDKVFTDRKQFFAAIEQAFGGKAGLETWYDHTWRKGLPDGAPLPSPTTGYLANGYLGQYLVVIPKHRIVAVRQMRARDPDPSKTAATADSFEDFPELVRQLVH